MVPFIQGRVNRPYDIAPTTHTHAPYSSFFWNLATLTAKNAAPSSAIGTI